VFHITLYYEAFMKKTKSSYHKERLDANPELREKAREASRKWYQKNKASEIKKSTEAKYKAPERYMLYTARGNAKRKNIEFSIVESDIVIPKFCPILGVLLETKVGNRGNNRASLDRIDSSKGYTKDNIQVISYLANRMKTDATVDELISFAKGILDLYIIK